MDEKNDCRKICLEINFVRGKKPRMILSISCTFTLDDHVHHINCESKVNHHLQLSLP